MSSGVTHTHTVTCAYTTVHERYNQDLISHKKESQPSTWFLVAAKVTGSVVHVNELQLFAFLVYFLKKQQGVKPDFLDFPRKTDNKPAVTIVAFRHELQGISAQWGPAFHI